MRTARLLPVSPSMHCSRGVYLVPGGVPGPEGCTCSWGMYLVRGCTWSRGGACSGGWLLLGGLVWGMPALGGCLVETPPPTATAAGGTHPTGMHSCYLGFFWELFLRKAVFSVYTFEYYPWCRVFQPLFCGDHCKHTFSCLCIRNKSCRNSLPSSRFCGKKDFCTGANCVAIQLYILLLLC